MNARNALFLSAMLLSTTAFSEVYSWTDAAGNRIFSDRPPAGQTPARKQAQPRKPSRRSQRDRINIEKLPERTRRLLAAMQSHREAVLERTPPEH